MTRLDLRAAMNRRTTRYLPLLALVAGGAVAVRAADGTDASATAGSPDAPRVAHAMPNAAAPDHPHAAPHPAGPPPRVTSDTVVVERESFGYTGGGRRDPFRSLMATAALRPLPSELRLVAVAFDPTGVSSVAILRDGTTKAQHRVGVGGRVGRMRVVRIRPRTVVFAVEELGFSRTEIVTLSDSSATKQP